MRFKACPDCGARSGPITGKARDARCLECGAAMNRYPLFLDYFGWLILGVLLVLAVGWIVLIGRTQPLQPF